MANALALDLKKLRAAIRRHDRKHGSLTRQNRNLTNLRKRLWIGERRLENSERFMRIADALEERAKKQIIEDDFCNLRRSDQNSVHVRAFVPKPLLAKGELDIPVVPLEQAIIVACSTNGCHRAAVVWSAQTYSYGQPIAAREYFGVCFRCGSVTMIPAGSLGKVLPPSAKPSF